MNEVSREEWASVVAATLADHPDWVDTTVQAMQAGMVEAIERQRDRVTVLSWGLYQALSTTRKAQRRDRQKIVQAIETSTLHPTVWSAAMIKKETDGQ